MDVCNHMTPGACNCVCQGISHPQRRRLGKSNASIEHSFHNSSTNNLPLHKSLFLLLFLLYVPLFPFLSTRSGLISPVRVSIDRSGRVRRAHCSTLLDRVPPCRPRQMRRQSMNEGHSLAFFVWFVSLLVGCFLIGRIVPEPYMDEIFHVRQTQQYWAGNWKHWDSKITTPPGLYLLGWLVCWFAQGLGTLDDDVCDARTLRLVNTLGALVCLAMFVRIRHKRTKEERTSGNNNVLLHAVTLAMYPFHFFYCLIYYTDVWSTVFVLLAYSFGTEGNCWISAMFGTCSLLMRQTNIFWFCFISAVSLRRFLIRSSQVHRKNALKNHFHSPLQEIGLLLALAWRKRFQVVYLFFPHGVLVCGFLALLYLNGGVVLGDRSAHAVSFHPTQLLYLALVFSTTRIFSSLKVLASGLTCIFDFARKKPVTFSAISVGMIFFLFFIIKEYTIYHPFLLADNRHFTFYFRRKILDGLPAGKYLMIPMYLISLVHISGEWRRSKLPFLEKMAWLVSTSLSVILSPLVELRYFNIPVILMLLLFTPTNDRNDWLSSVQYFFVNAIVLFAFLFRPFNWPDGSVARFIW